MSIEKFIFPFNPSTWVRVTQAVKTSGLMRIPDEKIRSRATLAFKHRIIKYSEWKYALLGYAKSQNFQFSVAGSAVYFFVPMPKRWSKKKKAALHFQLHLRKPDLSNYLKAFEDALLPKRDQGIGGYSGLGKFWTDTEQGWIEVHLNVAQYNPASGLYEVMPTMYVDTETLPESMNPYARQAHEKIESKMETLSESKWMDYKEAKELAELKSKVFTSGVLFQAKPPQNFPLGDVISASNTEAMEQIKELSKKRKRK